MSSRGGPLHRHAVNIPAALHDPADDPGDLPVGPDGRLIPPLPEGPEGQPRRDAVGMDLEGRPGQHPPPQILQGPLRQQASLLDEAEPGADLLGVPQLVGAEEDGDPLPPARQLPDQPVDVLGALRVQAGGGLVEEQHLRPVDQRPGQGEPLAHAGGVGGQLPVPGLPPAPAAPAGRPPAVGPPPLGDRRQRRKRSDSPSR